METQDNNLQKGSKCTQYRSATNIVWSISILVIVVIALLSIILCAKYPEVEEIKMFIEFSSTLLSITLSIFAIAFTYTSNNTIQQQFYNIDYSANKIEVSANNFQKTKDEISKSIRKLELQLQSIDIKVDLIKNKIPNILSVQPDKSAILPNSNLINSIGDTVTIM